MMRIELGARWVGRLFALLMFGSIAAGCSSQLSGGIDNSFVSEGSRAFSGEPSGSVPLAVPAPLRQLEHPPAVDPQVSVGRLAVSAAARQPRPDSAISAPPKGRPQVILLRGWFDVFSTGLDTLAEELRTKGIDAKAVGHLSWSTAVLDIRRERAGGKSVPLVLVGHSQGANNAVVVARSLKAQNIKVDLLVTLAPFLPPRVPGNVMRAVNYYQLPGWGSPLTPDQDFGGRLSNIDVAGEWTTFHITIDKSSRIHEEILREIAAL
jgi:hypothetical protein